MIRLARPRAGIPGGDETILLAEDEPGVRKLASGILAGRGYTVLEAGDGEEAIGVASRHGGPIHLLVADLVVPRLGGRETAERIQASRPGIRLLLMTGFTEHAALQNGVLPQGERLLQKPFTPAALLRLVREILDAPATGPDPRQPGPPPAGPG